MFITRKKTLNRMRERAERLYSNFSYYITKFDESKRFSGPSWYFHFRTLDRLRKHERLSDVFDDVLFFEYLYATLVSWGLHRMGPGGAKLVDFHTFKDSIRKQKNSIVKLREIRLLDLLEEEPLGIIDKIWRIIDKMEVSATKTKLTANSKALHHLLPNLIPPIDREYTIKFFFNNKTIGGRDERIFRMIYPWFLKIGLVNKTKIKKIVGREFHTSETKVIDNAIVGFVLYELK